jgi:hypothetical protein
MIKLLALVLAIAACGGTKPDKGTGPDGTGGGGSGSGATSGNGGGSGAAAPAPLTQDECRQMFSHILDIAFDARAKAGKPQPPPEKIAELKEQEIKDGMDACLASPRDQYQCIMAAKDVDALGACGAE